MLEYRIEYIYIYIYIDIYRERERESTIKNFLLMR